MPSGYDRFSGTGRPNVLFGSPLGLEPDWWLISLRGLFAIVLGIAAILLPGLAVTTLALLFGAYAVVDGAAAIVAAIRRSGRRSGRLPLLLEGVAGVVLGLAILVWPQIGQVLLVALVATWAIVTGVLEIIAALRLRRELADGIILAAVGAASVVLGILIVLFPDAGIVAVGWFIGAYALVAGIAMLLLGLRLRARHESSASPTWMVAH